MLLMNTKEAFLANILMMKKHLVKLKQTWMTEIRFNVLNHPIKKDSNEDMFFFSD